MSAPGDERESFLDQIYRPSLALLTDLYELTMAYAYWRTAPERQAVFHLFFRNQPYGGGFTVACGLTRVVEYLRRFRFERSDLDYLAGLTGADGRPLFAQAFLDELGALRLTCEVLAVPEGTLVFPYEPLVRVRGRIIECQILETALVNVLNFESLIATKAARLALATKGEPILEFGLRRAQGFDGALSASWASYVGGCAATSNVLAGKLFGIPVRGTHAHSWVMSWGDEPAAFEAFARALPNNCVLLVDTYDTLEGIEHAIATGRLLREMGHDLLGIRLDSGDLAYFSIEARKRLDAAGFQSTSILASNDLDEETIQSLKEQGAAIGVWGVGTRLVTGYGAGALGGVYKLGAVRDAGEKWRHVIKLSEQAAKVSTPGVQQIRRFSHGGEFAADMIYDELLGPASSGWIVDPVDPVRRRRMSPAEEYEDLLLPVYRDGQVLWQPPGIEAVRARVQDQLAHLHPGIKRFVHPHLYPAGLDPGLYALKNDLIAKARGA